MLTSWSLRATLLDPHPLISHLQIKETVKSVVLSGGATTPWHFLEMYGDIFDYHNAWGTATGIDWVGPG